MRDGRVRSRFAFLMVTVGLVSAATVRASTLFLAGDSTLDDCLLKPPYASWGRALEASMKPGNCVSNFAVSGTSTKSFRKTYWQNLISKVRSGDFVMIEFGHNDQKRSTPELVESTWADPRGLFRDIVREWVAEVRAKEATPVLLSPISRGRFDETGTHLIDTDHASEGVRLATYRDAMRELSEELGCDFVDMHTLTKNLMEKVGKAESEKFFVISTGLLLSKNGEPSQDITHPVKAGAKAFSELFLKDVRSRGLSVATLFEDDPDFVREWTKLSAFQAEGYLLPLSNATSEATLAVRTGTIPKVIGNLPSVGEVRARFTFDDDLKKGSGGFFTEYYVPNDGRIVYQTGAYGGSREGRTLLSGRLALTTPGAELHLGWPDEAKCGARLVKLELLWKGPVPMLREPANRARIADNRPTFAWWPQAPDAVVEISKRADFSGEVLTVPSDEMPAVRVPEPLSPGQYHWRIRYPHAQASEVRTFTQTASVRMDTTGPEIAAVPTSSDDPEGEVTVRIRDAAQVRARLDGRELAVRLERGRVRIAPPEGGWKSGLSKIRLAAADAKGNRSRSDLFFMMRPRLERVSWSPNRGFRIGQGPYVYPIGNYCVGSVEDIDLFAKMDSNFVQSYSRDSVAEMPSTGSGSEFARQMQEIADRGLHALQRPGSFFPRKIGDRTVSAYESLANRMGGLVGYRQIVAWYLQDEPDTSFSRMTPTMARRQKEFVKALDPTRPGLIICTMDNLVETFLPSCDVYMSEAYALGVADAWKKFDTVGVRLGGRPLLVCSCITADPKAGSGAPKINPDFPRNRQLLNIAIAAMMNGSGLMHFWWPRTDGEGENANVAAYFRELKRLVAVFAEPGERRRMDCGPLKMMELCGCGKKTYVAANITEETVDLADGRRIAPLGYLVSQTPIKMDD